MLDHGERHHKINLSETASETSTKLCSIKK